MKVRTTPRGSSSYLLGALGLSAATEKKVDAAYKKAAFALWKKAKTLYALPEKVWKKESDFYFWRGVVETPFGEMQYMASPYEVTRREEETDPVLVRFVAWNDKGFFIRTCWSNAQTEQETAESVVAKALRYGGDDGGYSGRLLNQDLLSLVLTDIGQDILDIPELLVKKPEMEEFMWSVGPIENFAHAREIVEILELFLNKNK